MASGPWASRHDHPPRDPHSNAVDGPIPANPMIVAMLEDMRRETYEVHMLRIVRDAALDGRDEAGAQRDAA